VLDEPVPVLLVPEVPVPVEPVEVPVPVEPVDGVPVTLVGAVPDGVDAGVPVVEPGALGSVVAVEEVPSALGVETGVDVTGVAAGLAGSTMLGGVPGPYRVLRWSGSSVSVSGGANGAVVTLERE
jgi:hypothetical protein